MKREASVIKYAKGMVDNGSKRETRHEVARVRGSVDSKYREGCQVAETAAAPLSAGTSWFSSGRGDGGDEGARDRGCKVASLIVGGSGGNVTLLVTS